MDYYTKLYIYIYIYIERERERERGEREREQEREQERERERGREIKNKTFIIHELYFGFFQTFEGLEETEI